jgi:hypothetical protein
MFLISSIVQLVSYPFFLNVIVLGVSGLGFPIILFAEKSKFDV